MTAAWCPYCIVTPGESDLDHCRCSACGRYFGLVTLNAKQVERKRDQRVKARQEMAAEMKGNPLFVGRKA